MSWNLSMSLESGKLGLAFLQFMLAGSAVDWTAVPFTFSIRIDMRRSACHCGVFFPYVFLIFLLLLALVFSHNFLVYRFNSFGYFSIYLYYV